MIYLKRDEQDEFAIGLLEYLCNNESIYLGWARRVNFYCQKIFFRKNDQFMWK